LKDFFQSVRSYHQVQPEYANKFIIGIPIAPSETAAISLIIQPLLAINTVLQIWRSGGKLSDRPVSFSYWFCIDGIVLPLNPYCWASLACDVGHFCTQVMETMHSPDVNRLTVCMQAFNEILITTSKFEHSVSFQYRKMQQKKNNSSGTCTAF
jgi:hypothetical protein